MTFEIQTTTKIESQAIADIMTTAIESGDPVTTASRGGWCFGIYWQDYQEKPIKGEDGNPWYATPAIYERPDFKIQVIEVAAEDDYVPGGPYLEMIARNIENGSLKCHALDHAAFVKGLHVIAEKDAGLFGDLRDPEAALDAAEADTFLQLLVLGEIVYG